MELRVFHWNRRPTGFSQPLRDLRPALFSCMIFGKTDTMTQLRQVYDSQKYVFAQRCFEGTELCIFTDTAHPWEPAEFPEKQEMTEKFAQENMEGQLRMIDQIFRPVIQNGDYDAFIQGVTWMASELKKRGQEQRKDWQLYDEEVPETSDCPPDPAMAEKKDSGAFGEGRKARQIRLCSDEAGSSMYLQGICQCIPECG